MAEMLRDIELKAIVGKIIVDGDPASIRPNSYVLRLGADGEFLNSEKVFKLGKKKKGIRVSPGHSVGITSRESINFSSEVVNEFFPDHDLHGFISPTTDLAREGIVAPTTQVDAGYRGTLNWTIVNTSSQERRFVYEERCFRLTIFKLARGERPDRSYRGDYQGKSGYVRSERRGAPVGMKEHEWEDSTREGGPEEMLQGLINSGYPWNILGERLKRLDDQFKTVTLEYADIRDSLTRLEEEFRNSLTRLEEEFRDFRREQGNVRETVREIVREEIPAMQDRFLVRGAVMVAGAAGLGITISATPALDELLNRHGNWSGLVILAAAAFYFLHTSRKRK